MNTLKHYWLKKFKCVCPAISHDERFKAIYARLVAKHGIKMKAAVVVQRKLLEMVYTIYKTGVAYDKDYFKKQDGGVTEQRLDAAAI